MFKTSDVPTAYEFNAEPAIVAEACCSAFEQLGDLRNVSRETGTIQGQVLTWNPFGTDAELLLTISRTRAGTRVAVQSSAIEGVVSDSSAQKAVARFIETLSQDTRLAGKTAQPHGV